MPTPAARSPVRAAQGWFRRQLPRLTLVGVATLIAAAVVTSYTVTIVIDEGGENTGDETNSLTLAWTAYTAGIPSYGVLSDGTPWTLGDLTLPAFYAIYGSRLAHVDPGGRIEAARAISRLLVGLSLVLALVALAWAGGFPQVRDRGRLATLLLALTSVCFLFAAHESFVFVSGFGRVDALGLLALCVSVAGLAAFRRSPTFGSLFAYSLTVLFAYLSNNIAFVLVAAIFVLAVAAQLRRERLASFARALGAAAAVGLSVDFLLNHLWLTETVSTSTLYPDAGSVTGDLARRLTQSPEAVFSYAWERYPELIGAIVVTMLAAVVCLVWAHRSRRGEPASFSRRELAIAGLAVPLGVGWIGLTAVPTPRVGYLPMLLVAVALPYLLVVAAGRGLRFAWLDRFCFSPS